MPHCISKPRKRKIKFRKKDKCFYVSIYLGNGTGTNVLFEIIFLPSNATICVGSEKRR